MRRWYFSLMLSVMLMGCASASPEATDASPTNTATVEVTEIPSNMPTLEPTLAPTRRPTLTRSPTETPTSTPVPEGYYNWVNNSHPHLTVYRRNDAICVIQSGVSSFVMSAGSIYYAEVSPDGAVIVLFTSHIMEIDGVSIIWTELWTMKPDGSDRRQILDFEKLYPHDALGELANPLYRVGFEDRMWIPGTHRLLFTSSNRDVEMSRYEYAVGVDYFNDLYALDADTGEIQTVLEPGRGGAFITSSPDGRMIALLKRGDYTMTASYEPDFQSPDTISLIGLEGFTLQADMVTYEPPLVLTYNAYAHFDPVVNWLPDSSGVFVAIFPEIPPSRMNVAIEGWFLPVNGTAELRYRIHPLNMVNISLNDIKPYPSADGRYVLVQGEFQGQNGLQVIDTQTMQGSLVEDVGQLMSFVRWEADSQHFILKSSDGANYYRADVMGAIMQLGPQPTRTQSPTLPECAP